jgi:hypothetical protein
MKTFLKLLALLMIGSLWIGCKSYRPIEKVTVKTDPAFSKNENLLRQFNQVAKGEKIQIILKNGETHLVTYQSHSADSVLTNLPQKAKKASQDPISKTFNLLEIEKVNVWSTDYVLTWAIPGAVLIGGIIYWATWDLNLGLGWDQTN